MRLLMFRHAERENSGSSNPPLSARGLRQAQKLVEDIDLSMLPRPTKLMSSPKLRAQQTFQQIENHFGIPLQVHPDLDERQSSEPPELFARRVQRFLNSLNGQAGVIYFVSHLDWIEEALVLIPSDTDLLQDRFQTWLPAQSLEFEMQDGLWLNPVLRRSSC
jgi:phosphohistidine phosphatase SixA